MRFVSVTVRTVLAMACMVTLGSLLSANAQAATFSCDDIPDGCCIDEADGTSRAFYCDESNFLRERVCLNVSGGVNCGWTANYGGSYQCSTNDDVDPGGATRACPGTLAEFTDCDGCKDYGRFCGYNSCGEEDGCGVCAEGWTCLENQGLCTSSPNSPNDAQASCCDGDMLWRAERLTSNSFAPGEAIDCKALMGPAATCRDGRCVKYSAPRADGYTNGTAFGFDPAGWSGYDFASDDVGPSCVFAPTWTAPNGTAPTLQCKPDCWGKDGGDDGCGGTCPTLPAGHCWDAEGGPWGGCYGECDWNEYRCGSTCIPPLFYCDGYQDCTNGTFDDEPEGCSPANPPLPGPSYCDWDTGECVHTSQCKALTYYYSWASEKNRLSTQDWLPHNNSLPPFAKWTGGAATTGLIYAEQCSSGFCLIGRHFNVVPCGTSSTSMDPTQDCGGCETYKTAAHGTATCSVQGYGFAKVSICLCTPDCSGRQCGDDGCGGTCGTCDTGSCQADGTCSCTPSCSGCGGSDGCGGVCDCPSGQICNSGTCCTPSCSGKACGDDGCGGTCGSCDGTFNGQGVCDSQGQCACDGTGVCSTKSCGTDGCGNACSQQCPSYTPCDDSAGTCGVCEPQCAIQNWECGGDGCGGTCGSGPNDGCGTGLACNAATHQCECAPQCDGKTCGADGCGGTCGSCDQPGELCFSDNCCVPNCSGKVCGDDGCGGTCGPGCSSSQEICTGAGQCQCLPNCQGKQCGDDGCGGSCGDCSPQFDGQGVCGAGDQCECAPQCVGAQCGDGGCAAQPDACGTCSGGDVCIGDQCCVPDCTGKSCGADGCGGSCGSCGAGTGCDAPTGQCTCIPDCAGKSCGDDGCGGSCSPGCTGPGESCNGTGQCECTAAETNQECGGGLCASQYGAVNCGALLGLQYTCDAAQGQCVCVPNCDGKQCGNDGCGGTCGTGCAATEQCTNDQCVCTPQCTNADGSARECGSDSCGQSCGTCESDEVCNDGTCYPEDLGCAGKTCGPNILGVADACGTCGTGEFCQAATGTCRYNTCPGVPTAGCCDGNTLRACAEGDTGAGSFVQLDCSTVSGYCGWDATTSTYDCLTAPSAATGDTPQQCFGACTPDCTDKSCGDDGCGGTCGSCTGTDAYCDFNSGTCKTNPCSAVPNVGCCQGANLVTCDATTQTATSTYCPAQGGGTCGWKASAGAYACGTEGTAEPSGTHVKACTAAVCVPSCTGKTCGSDGCGGICGTCSSDSTCLQGNCCTPDCTDKECGSDGCGGTCGTCAGGQACNDDQGVCIASTACAGVPFGVGCCDGQTFKVCEPAYGLKAIDCSTGDGRCGWDSKAQSYACNTIGAPEPSSTHAWACAGGPVCVPDCSGKVCGPDGCGGTCGTCPAGESCDNAAGTCSAACGGIPPEGCCGGPDNNTLTWCGNSGGAFADINTVNCGPAKDSCGWNASVGSYLCSTDGLADPLGAHPKACPVIACTPDCTGKVCGDDGCGGTCGACNSGQTCNTGGLCEVATVACGTVDWKGNCAGNLLQFCSPDGRLVTENCGPGETCGPNPAIGPGAYSCNTPNPAGPPSPAGTCTDRCDTITEGESCQCDQDCAFRGDCCSDLTLECPSVGVTECDPSDACGKFNYLGTAQADPPWRLPLPRTLENSGKPGAQRRYRTAPLDDVLPQGTPYAVEGLVAYVPRAGVSAGHPGSGVVSTAGVSNALAPAGKLGDAIDFSNASGGPAKGATVVTLARPVGQRPHWAGQAPGGFSVALWAKVSATAPDVPNPLLSAWGHGSATRRVCASSRPDDATVTVTCPAIDGVQSTIKQVHGYYGDVATAPGVPADTCLETEALEPTFSCFDRGFQASIKSCVGKSSCTLNAWELANDSDPCAQAPDPSLQATAIVQAVCGASSAGTGHVANLWVDASDEAYKVRYELPGQKAMRSTASARCETPPCSDGDGKGWHHIALTFHPFPGNTKLGITSLYVDGDLQSSRSDLSAPRIDEVVLGRGYQSTYSAALPNGVSDNSPGNRAAAAMLDEVFIFDRALSPQEVRGLKDKATQRVLRTWPPVAARRTISEKLWTDAGTTGPQAISVDHILASGSNEERLTASQPAVSVQGQALNITSVDPELNAIADFTLAAWIRVPDLSVLPDGALMTLFDTGVPIAGLTRASGCSGGSVTGFIGAVSTVAGTDCSHGLTPERWAFVALWQKGGQQRVYVDGHLSSSSTSAAQTLFAGASGEIVFQTSPGVQLAWATLYDKALDHSELQLQRRQGPAVWLDGVTYNTLYSSDLRVRDFAAFMNDGPFDAEATSLRPTLWKTAQAPAFGPAAQGPIELSSSAWSALTIPANGMLGAEPGAPAGPFTWSGRVSLPVSDQVSTRLVRLYRAGSTTGAEFASRLVCNKASDGISHACQVFIVAKTNVGTKLSQATSQWVGDFSSADVIDLDVAVSFTGSALRVALGSRSVALANASEEPQVPANGNYDSFIGSTAVPAHVTFDQFRMEANGATSAKWHEVRLYPRALSGLELTRLTQRTCAGLNCTTGGRQCLKGGDAGLVTCSPCAGATESNSVAGGLCLDAPKFFQRCANSEECQTGLCRGGRCLEQKAYGNDKPASCVKECRALGRSCIAVASETLIPTTSDYPGKLWTCSPSCREYFEAPSTDPKTGQCLWKPDTGADEACDNDDQCLSGVCATLYRSVYDYGSLYSDPLADVRRCAPKDADACHRRHQQSSVNKATGEVSCSPHCVEQLLNGKPLWRRAWTVMSMNACETIVANAKAKELAGEGTGLLHQRITLQGLSQLLLGKPAGSTVFASDIAKMRKLGVGRQLIRYANSKPSPLDSEPRVFFYDCTRLFYPTSVVAKPGCNPKDPYQYCDIRTPFSDRSKNRKECVPNTLPNGSQCPPQGVNAPEFTNDEWCDSGYCSRVSGRCEDGGAAWQATQSAGRNDASSGSADFGLFKILQDNRAGLTMGRVSDAVIPNVENDRWFSLKSNNATSLGVLDLKFEVVRATTEMQSASVNTKKATRAVSQFIFGLQVLQPPNIAFSDPVSAGCASQFIGGTFADTGCTVARLGDGKPIIPKVKACAPVPDPCANEDSKGKPKYASGKPYTIAKKTCLRKQVFVGSVPVSVVIGPTLDLCLTFGAYLDSETFEPGYSLGPEFGIGLAARAFPGTSFTEAFLQVGLRADVTLLSLGFPTTWGMRVKKINKSKVDSVSLKNVYTVEYFRETSAVLTILAMKIDAYAEFGVSILKTSFEYNIIDFPGFQFSWLLSSVPTRKITFDLEAPGSSFY